MIRAGLERCREMGFEAAFVLGSAAFYSRFGFRPATDFGVEALRWPRPAFQAVELVPGALARVAGSVRLAAELEAPG